MFDKKGDEAMNMTYSNSNSNEKKLDVTIVTINWNVTDKLQKCIDSVINTCNDIKYKMFIIDNNSQDINFNDIIKKYLKYKQLKFIKNNVNEGALALNKIRDKIQGRYLLILGPDAILKRNTVKELIKFMDSKIDAGAASGKLLNPDGSPQLYYFKFWNLSMVFYINTIFGRIIDQIFFSNKKRRYYLGQDLNTDSVIEIDQPPGACLIVRPELVIKDGYIIDPEFSFYYNDVDLCKRIWNKGYKIYLVPSAEVIHNQSSSFKKADPVWKIKEYTRSQIKYFRKYYKNKVWLLKAIIILNCLFLIFAYTLLIINPKRKISVNLLKENIKTMLWMVGGVLRW